MVALQAYHIRGMPFFFLFAPFFEGEPEVNKDSWKRFAKSLTVRDKLVFTLMEEPIDSVSGRLEDVYGQLIEEYGRSKVCADIKKTVEVGLTRLTTVFK